MGNLVTDVTSIAAKLGVTVIDMYETTELGEPQTVLSANVSSGSPVYMDPKGLEKRINRALTKGGYAPRASLVTCFADGDDQMRILVNNWFGQD